MNYEKNAKEILGLVGGKENVENVSHCYTRLRFSLKDNTLADADKIKEIDGVLEVKEASGQFQVVIGTEVDKVYKFVEQMVGDTSANKEPKKHEKKGIKGWASAALDTLTSCFTPIIPVIAGCGMIKVLCAILLNCHILADSSSTYQILSLFGDSVYYFLPIFVGYTAAKKMDTDPFLGMVMGAILLHPNFAALGAKGAQYTSFLSIPVRIVTYSTQALPIILSVWLMKYVDKFTDKICPSLVKVFLRPMLTILITAPIMLALIGPLGTILGDYFQVFCNMMNKWGWVAVGLNAVIFPFLVMTGMHNALIPLMIQMFATQGFDAILVPSGLIANIAEGGAAFGVFLKSKNKGVKGTSLSASISSLFGITEPALYGVNLRFKRPFIAMLIGSLAGGCLAGLMHVIAYSFVSPSIVSIAIFAGKGSSLIWAIISVIFTFVFTAILTWIMGFDDLESDEEQTIKTPINGEVVELNSVSDSAFASGAMGKGVAIIPTEGKVVAPFDCQVVALFPTKHAIGLKRVDGLEMLIHIGFDTVNLNGEGFDAKVKMNDHVKAGDTLITFDLEGLKAKGYDMTTPIIITNSNDYKSIEPAKLGSIHNKEVILNVQ